MCSQWDQGPCWTLKAGAICSVLCHSHLQSPSFLGIGTSVKDFSLVQWTKGPDKAILGETTHRITLQTLFLLLKHTAHSFFLGLWTILIIFFFLTLLWLFHDSLLYTIFYGSVKIHKKISDFYLVCSLLIYFALKSNQLNIIQWDKLTGHCHLGIFYPRKKCAFSVLV